jgi:hypothetical protein
MKMNKIRLLGLTTSITYFLSLAVLFSFNKYTLQEVPVLSVTGFNIEGLPEQYRVMFLNYILPGLSMTLFGYYLSREFKKQSQGRIGGYMLVLSGISWMSFSFTPLYSNAIAYDFEWIHLIKSFFAWTGGIVGLMLTSTEFDKIHIPKNVKWLTITIAGLMLIEMFYYWFEDYSGIISAISWTIYFTWFGIFATQKRFTATTI